VCNNRIIVNNELERKQDSLIDHVDGVKRLRTATTSEPIVLSPGDMSACSAMMVVMMILDTPDSSTRALWQSYQQRHLGASRSNRRRSENFAYQYLRDVNGSLTCRKILRHGNSRFTSHPKEGVLQIFIALKNSSPWPGLNPRPLDPVTSTLINRRIVITKFMI
jgi:hypothetical protein